MPMQGLVHGANADVMPTLMLIALYSSGGKRVMHARGKGRKCNTMVVGQYFGKAEQPGALSGVQLSHEGAVCQASAVGIGDASVESERLKEGC